MEKLSKDDLAKCVAWLAELVAGGVPVGKTIWVGQDLHQKLWRFAILHRRDAGKLRVLNNTLWWRNVPVKWTTTPEVVEVAPPAPSGGLYWKGPVAGDNPMELPMNVAEAKAAGYQTDQIKVAGMKVEPIMIEEPRCESLLQPRPNPQSCVAESGVAAAKKVAIVLIALVGSKPIVLTEIVVQIQEDDIPRLLAILRTRFYEGNMQIELVDR